MATPPPSTSPDLAEHQLKYQLTVNSYDRTASLIVALLVLVGCTVLGMAVVFFTGKFVHTIEPIPVVPVEATSPSANQGLAEEPDPPGIEEAPDLSEPQLQDTLETLTNVITDKHVLLSDEMLDAKKEAGKGQGLGDARMAGAGDGVVERVPRWQRWKIRFQPESAGEFARWLDYHKIEIGVLGRDNQVHYGYELSNSVPKVKVGDPLKETRGYTSAADGPMPALTMELARKANVARFGPVVLLFYPFEVESVLWTMERAYSEARDVNTIRETVFTIVRDGKKFAFEVIDQKYF
ncbi:MAG: hypothetical protein IH831_00465 [Planctomycetes bacterium]|nr:hypothetical protein [Planctomycetota bacterium]